MNVIMIPFFTCGYLRNPMKSNDSSGKRNLNF